MCVALSNNQNRFISFFPSTASCFLRSAPGHPLTDLHSGRCSRKSAFSCFTDILGHASSDTPHRIDHLIRRNLAEDSRTRLRNISGMILVDFINLKKKEQQQKLISVIREELQKDSVPANFIDITRLGLVELTRKKVYKSLREILS